MGMSYSMGLIPNRNSEGTKWLRKAADKGHAKAKEYLELMKRADALNIKVN